MLYLCKNWHKYSLYKEFFCTSIALLRHFSLGGLNWTFLEPVPIFHTVPIFSYVILIRNSYLVFLLTLTASLYLCFWKRQFSLHFAHSIIPAGLWKTMSVSEGALLVKVFTQFIFEAIFVCVTKCTNNPPNRNGEKGRDKNNRYSYFDIITAQDWCSLGIGLTPTIPSP